MSKNRKVSLINYDDLYNEAVNPRFLNDLLVSDTGKSVLDLIFQRSEGDLEYEPHCSCNTFRGVQYEGHVCPFCGSTIISDFTSNFVPNNWIRISDNLPPIIHPRFYLILTSFASRMITTKRGSKITGKKQKIPIIDFILNPDLELPDDLKPGIHGQGFDYFCENMEEIMNYLFVEHPRFSRLEKADMIMRIYNEYKDRLIIRKLPILHQSFHPMHIRGRTKTMDKTADLILPAVLDMANAEFTVRRNVSRKNYANREVWKIFTKYIDYIKKVMESKLGDKQALIRRHNIAARIFWTGRGVISPINGPHDGDEIHLPWNIAMYGLQLEIINFLCNRYDYTPTDAFEHFFKHVNKFDPTIYKIMETLIKECPYKGLPIGINRNPTLLRTSIRLGFSPKVKKDPNDKTINLSQRICSGFNADNDGDEMNIYFIKEMGTVKFAMRMHPREGILSETSLGVSSWVKPTKEAFIHMNQFLHYERENTAPCDLDLSECLLMYQATKKTSSRASGLSRTFSPERVDNNVNIGNAQTTGG